MDWSDDDIGNLARETQIQRFAVGRDLIKEGEQQDYVMIIFRGFCEASRIIDGKSQVFRCFCRVYVCACVCTRARA